MTRPDRKSTRLNSSHPSISYAVFCLKKKKNSAANSAHSFSCGAGPRRTGNTAPPLLLSAPPLLRPCVNLIPLLPPFLFFFFLMIRRPPRSTLFPYTPPFRSGPGRRSRGRPGRHTPVHDHDRPDAA